MMNDATSVDRLLRLERMMTTAYDEALGKINDARITETLGVLRKHHQQSWQTLQQIAQGSEGSAPQVDGPFSRYVQEVLDTIGDAVRRDEALGELRVAEAALGMTYGQTLDELQDSQVSAAVKEIMTTEKEHVGVLAMAHETSRTGGKLGPKKT